MSPPSPISNPILPGFNPDPSITSVPGVGYFIVTSSFTYWPGLPIYHSEDLKEWKVIGHAIQHGPGMEIRTTEEDGGLWAPTIRYRPTKGKNGMGRFYVTCSLTHRFKMADETCPHTDVVPPRGFYVWTDDIFSNQWSSPIFFDELGIDQDLFFDETTDRTYLSVTRTVTDEGMPPDLSFNIGVYACEIDLETGTSLGRSTLLRWSPTGCAEGSHILAKDGKFYLFVAEGGTEEGHHETVFVSDSPLGPYTGGRRILGNPKTHPDIRNTGHMDLVQSLTNPDQWWAVFLGVRPQFEPQGWGMSSHLGRETFMAPLSWVDGWPVVNEGLPIELGPAKPLQAAQILPLDSGWYTFRTPLKLFHKAQGNRLSILGNAFRLDVKECHSMMLRKQTAFTLDFTVEMAFVPEHKGHEAGVVVWHSETSHIRLGLTSAGLLAQQAGKTPIKVACSSPIFLRIQARPNHYIFSSRQQTSEDWNTLLSVPSNALQPRFTGTHIGVYAQGFEERPCLQWAHFHDLTWQEIGR